MTEILPSIALKLELLELQLISNPQDTLIKFKEIINYVIFSQQNYLSVCVQE